MELRFRVPSEDEMDRPPTQRDQFDNDDVELVDALVREAIQNSLDAKDRAQAGPIRVRFSIETLESERLAAANSFIQPELLNRHLQACDFATVDSTSPMRILVVEDFGTTGLIGQWSKLDELPFSDFWRRMGKSHKGGQALGRWGLGKLVFSSASRARVFLGLTKRASDPERLLMGQAVLTTHHLADGTRQDSHGFYADDGQGIQLPVRNEADIARFRAAFGISRDSESGLSIVVPFVRNNISLERIVKGVLRNYFFPILFGRLEVQVGDTSISADTFAELTAQVDPTHFAGGELASFIKVMKESRDSGAHKPLLLPKDWAKGTTLDSALGSHLERLREQLNSGGVAAIRAPILLKRKDGKELLTFIDAFLQRASTDAPALFVRGSIVLNAEQKYFRGRKVFAAIIADDASISEFLGDAENPAHTGWSAAAEKVTARWKAPRERLVEVRQLLQRVHNALVSAVETLDQDALIDVFSIPSDEGTKGGPRPGQKIDPRDLSKIVAKPRKFRVVDLSDGFGVRPGMISDEELPFSIRVRLAYDVLRGNPFSKHDPADFDLRAKQLQVSGRGATLIAKGPSILQLDITAKDFEVDVRGFDKNRDLIIDSEVA